MGTARPLAVALWQRVLNAAPDHPGALLSLGDAARQRGDVTGAESLLTRAVAVAPGLAPARCALANLLLHSGRDEEAGRQFWFAQTRAAMTVAEGQGFAPIPLEVLKGRPHGPQAEAVLAWFEAQSKRP